MADPCPGLAKCFTYHQNDKNHEKSKHLKIVGPHNCGLTFLVVHLEIEVEGTYTTKTYKFGIYLYTYLKSYIFLPSYF